MDARIDPHVHCRDWEQSYKATIKSVTEVARSQGVAAIFDMPNTAPPITTEELVRRRLQTAKDEGCLDGYYLYVGITGDQKQAREAVALAQSNDKVIGLKMFAGKSVGGLAIPEQADQEKVYDALAEAGYTGVVAVHCEKEAYARPDLWNPRLPYTWNQARPEKMEIESVRDQIMLASGSGFKGNLHICHISTPDAVKLVMRARHTMRVTCGVTPHHITYSTSNMQSTEGVAYKVNPPIRSPETVAELKKLLMQGEIDWIETDHAPHTHEEKSYSPNGSFMSGIQSLGSYAQFVQKLIREGMSEDQVRRMTYSNIKKVFTKIVE